MREPEPLHIEILRQNNLAQIARETGVSRRHLIRIRDGEVRQVRERTHQVLEAYVSSAEPSKKLFEQLLQQSPINYNALFKLLQDPQQTGLKIHQAMTTKGWTLTEFMFSFLGIESVRAKPVHYNTRRHPDSVYQQEGSSPFWSALYFDDVILVGHGQIYTASTKKRSRAFRFSRTPNEWVVTELDVPEDAVPVAKDFSFDSVQVKQIMLGERVIQPDELFLFAKALQVEPRRLFVANEHGLRLFRNVLQESTKNQEVSSVLNELRTTLGLTW